MELTSSVTGGENENGIVVASKTVPTYSYRVNTLLTHFIKVTENGVFIRVFAFTRAEWLDVVELTFSNGYIQVRTNLFHRQYMAKNLFHLIYP